MPWFCVFISLRNEFSLFHIREKEVDFEKLSISKTLRKHSPNFSYAEGCFSFEAQKKNEVVRQKK